MPEFEVTINATRSMTCTLKVTVTADDEEEAQDEAMEQATSGELIGIDDRWDISHTDFDIAKVEATDDDHDDTN